MKEKNDYFIKIAIYLKTNLFIYNIRNTVIAKLTKYPNLLQKRTKMLIENKFEKYM